MLFPSLLLVLVFDVERFASLFIARTRHFSYFQGRVLRFVCRRRTLLPSLSLMWGGLNMKRVERSCSALSTSSWYIFVLETKTPITGGESKSKESVRQSTLS